MNFERNPVKTQGPISPAEALAAKDSALKAILGYLEHKAGPNEWYKDELAYRIYRQVTKALEIQCDFNNDASPRFAAQKSAFRQS